MLDHIVMDQKVLLCALVRQNYILSKTKQLFQSQLRRDNKSIYYWILHSNICGS